MFLFKWTHAWRVGQLVLLNSRFLNRFRKQQRVWLLCSYVFQHLWLQVVHRRYIGSKYCILFFNSWPCEQPKGSFLCNECTIDNAYIQYNQKQQIFCSCCLSFSISLKSSSKTRVSLKSTNCGPTISIFFSFSCIIHAIFRLA